MKIEEAKIKALELVDKVDGELLFLLRMGSHLYGTDTKESNFNYRGIYLPDKRKMLCGEFMENHLIYRSKPKKEKLGPGDSDMNIFPIQSFLGLTKANNSLAKIHLENIEMCHMMKVFSSNVCYTGHVAAAIYDNRTKFIGSGIPKRLFDISFGMLNSKEYLNANTSLKMRYHVYRVLYMAVMYAKTGGLTFPFEDDVRQNLIDIKLGNMSDVNFSLLLGVLHKEFSTYDDKRRLFSLRHARELISEIY